MPTATPKLAATGEDITRADIGRTAWILHNDGSGIMAPRFPGEWTIERVNPRTIHLTQPVGEPSAPEGRRHGLNADRSLIVFTEPPRHLTVQALRAAWGQGTLVRWEHAPASAGTKLFIVIKDEGLPGKVNRLVPVGGNGRWYSATPAALTRLDPEAVIPDFRR